jgi:hypothetical protein
MALRLGRYCQTNFLTVFHFLQKHESLSNKYKIKTLESYCWRRRCYRGNSNQPLSKEQNNNELLTKANQLNCCLETRQNYILLLLRDQI